MKAVICDRCGRATADLKRGKREYTLRKISYEIVNKQMSRGSEIDLCDKCYSELISWFKNSQNQQLL